MTPALLALPAVAPASAAGIPAAQGQPANGQGPDFVALFLNSLVDASTPDKDKASTTDSSSTAWQAASSDDSDSKAADSHEQKQPDNSVLASLFAPVVVVQPEPAKPELNIDAAATGADHGIRELSAATEMAPAEPVTVDFSHVSRIPQGRPQAVAIANDDPQLLPKTAILALPEGAVPATGAPADTVAFSGVIKCEQDNEKTQTRVDGPASAASATEPARQPAQAEALAGQAAMRAAAPVAARQVPTVATPAVATPAVAEQTATIMAAPAAPRIAEQATPAAARPAVPAATRQATPAATASATLQTSTTPAEPAAPTGRSQAPEPPASQRAAAKPTVADVSTSSSEAKAVREQDSASDRDSSNSGGQGRQADSGATTYPAHVSGHGSSPAQSTAPAAQSAPTTAPVQVNAVDELDAKAPKAALQDLTISLNSTPGKRVDLVFAQKGEDVKVTVRAQDANVASALNAELPRLEQSLQDKGYTAELWSGTTTHSTTNDGGTDARSSSDQRGQGFQNPYPHAGQGGSFNGGNGQADSSRQQGQTWSAEMEDLMNESALRRLQQMGVAA